MKGVQNVNTDQCPVCKMTIREVGEKELVHSVYHGIRYHFCSAQCAQNFSRRPRLYLNDQTEGKALIKRGRLEFQDELSDAMQQKIRQTVAAMMGIHDVSVSARRMNVVYDLMQVTSEQIEARLMAADVSLDKNWQQRMRLAWHHYTEENELDQLAAPGAPCCNRPPTKRS